MSKKKYEDTSSLNSEVIGAQADQQQTGEQDPIMGDIPDRFSLVRNYVPAGAEEEESSSSQGSVSEPEATVEEGLADFFSNSSHRTTDPISQQPVEAEENWGDHLYHTLIKLQGLREDKDIS